MRLKKLSGKLKVGYKTIDSLVINSVKRRIHRPAPLIGGHFNCLI